MRANREICCSWLIERTFAERNQTWLNIAPSLICVLTIYIYIHTVSELVCVYIYRVVEKSREGEIVREHSKIHTYIYIYIYIYI